MLVLFAEAIEFFSIIGFEHVLYFYYWSLSVTLNVKTF